MHSKLLPHCILACTQFRGLLRRPILQATIFLLLMNTGASAVPSFAEQTGQRCSMCHVGGLGPQLTPFGRLFKLGGYTLRSGTQFTMPLAGMIVASFLHTQKD